MTIYHWEWYCFIILVTEVLNNVLKLTEKEISHFEVNIMHETINLFRIRCTKTILTTSYHISIKMLSQAISSVYFPHRQGLLCDIIFAKHHIVPQLVYKHSDQLSDSDKSFDILRDIKPYSFEPLVQKVTDSINCKELTGVSA